ncbi:MAG: DUF1501 domain-containing protein [Saprospiraceae bacterium]|nr:DUF1501 domain-containing protein [Saprospiraceae bacterium]
MKRRSFIKKGAATAIGLPIMLHGQKLSALTRHALFNGMNSDSDRILVLIQLNGGNDGLNMVLPLDQYSQLFTARENILIPESSALQLSAETGLHPAMTHLKEVFDEGRLCLVQNVGYPDQNRSHFRSTDIWQTASAANQVLSTGWAGRFFDQYVPDYPNGYPNGSYPDPFAITIGSIISETCQGVVANYSLALQDPSGLSPLLEDDEVNTDPTQCYGKELAFVRTSILQTNAYGEVITQAAEKGANLVDYPADNRLAQQLKTIALLISGGLKTRIYVASLGGFDTHANQVDATDTTTGGHANLLRTLSEAIAVFQTDLVLQQLDKRVVGMTYSEFGRRIRSNGANGTDHGSAAPLFVFGSCVNPTIIGDNPIINEEVDPQEGVAMQHDFRSVYGSLLHQWLEVPKEDVEGILFDAFAELPLIQGCETTSVETSGTDAKGGLKVWPNPFTETAQVEFRSLGETVRLSIFNAAGFEVGVLTHRYWPAGVHVVPFTPGHLPSGNYYVHLRTSTLQQTLGLIFKQ